MNKERLLLLAEALENWVPEDNFDMSFWSENQEKSPTPGCGFVGCALGWSATIWPDHFFVNEERVYLSATKEKDYEAASSFFGLTLHQACSIFEPSYYPKEYDISTQEVAERIYEVIEEQS